MISAKDLQIGDWYAFRGHPYKCTASDIASIAECEEKGAPTDISEIPLTAEILEKNGWAHYEDDKDSFHDEDCVFLKQKEGGYGVCIDNVLRTISGIIHYVHELQQALRLCGIEKEIEL